MAAPVDSERMPLIKNAGSLRGLLFIWVGCFLAFAFSGRLGGALFGMIWPFQLLGILFMLGSVLFLLISPIIALVRKSYEPLILAGINLAAMVAVVVTAYGVLPVHQITNAVRGEPLIWASYTGTQNSSAIALRTNGRYDIVSTAWPGVSDYYHGSYTIEGDRVELQPKEESATIALTEAVIRDDELQFSLEGKSRPLRYTIHFNKVK